jgi:bacillithiol system protein YtxJ
MTELASLEQLELALKLPLVVIFKHSPRCPLSRSARSEVGRLEQERPDVPIFVVDVLRNPDLSKTIEERTGVKHESPQSIVLCEGVVKWHASHYDVTRVSLRENLAA